MTVRCRAVAAVLGGLEPLGRHDGLPPLGSLAVALEPLQRTGVVSLIVPFRGETSHPADLLRSGHAPLLGDRDHVSVME